MTSQGTDEATRWLKQRVREAVSLAMESQWQDAAALNREVLAQAPNDVEAWNRLGKALLELGEYGGAREAFERSLALSPHNAITAKNLERLKHLATVPVPRAQGLLVDATFFIEESGKTAKATLVSPAEVSVLTCLSVGEVAELRHHDDKLAVHTSNGTYLGTLALSLGHRLIRLMDGGNLYKGAVFSVVQDRVTVLLRETYRHWSQGSIISFPTPAQKAATPAATRAAPSGLEEDAPVGLRPVDPWREDEADQLSPSPPWATGYSGDEDDEDEE